MNTFISSNTNPLFENITPYNYLEPIKLLAEHHKEIKPNYYRDILSGQNYDKLLKNKEDLPQSDINDRIMLEYSKCFSDNNFIVVYPKALSKKDKLKDLFKLLNDNGRVYYKKYLTVDYYQAYNLVYQLYANSPRMKSNNHIVYKLDRLGFKLGYTHEILIIVYQHLNIANKINGSSTPFKSEIRNIFLSEDIKNINIDPQLDIYPREYDYIHVNDTFNETINYSYLFLDSNTIEFTKKQLSWRLIEFSDGIITFNKVLQLLFKLPLLERNKFLFISSTVLFSYGIRAMNDIDGFMLDNTTISQEIKEYIDKNDKSIDIYYNNAFDKANINKEWEDTLNERAKLLGASNFNELVINPKYHYYFMGVKLLKLENEIILRNLRGRPAQLTDLLAINRLLNINIKTSIPISIELFNTEEKTTETKIVNKKEYISTMKHYFKRRYFINITDEQVESWLNSTNNTSPLIIKPHDIEINSKNNIYTLELPKSYTMKDLYYKTPNISNNKIIFPTLIELSKMGFNTYSSIFSDDKPYIYYGEDWKKSDLCDRKPREIFDKRDNKLRVLTFNVHNFITRCNQGIAPLFNNNFNQFKNGRDFSKFYEFFKKVNADVICLQEFVPILDKIPDDITDYNDMQKINFEYINEQMKKLGYNYSCIGDTVKNNFTLNEPRSYYMICNAIYSKLPIEEEKILHLFINRNITAIKINYNHQPVWILNTHLAYYPDKTPIDLKKDTIVLQFEVIKYIIENEFKDNIIFCGDFNINLYTQQNNYRYKNFDKVKNITNLFNNSSKISIPTNFSQNEQTDYILYSKNSKLHPAYSLIINSDLSDHNPILTDFYSS
jgi:endonuclease/exonuclease/phosphatase family metal-dependent hydrolase